MPKPVLFFDFDNTLTDGDVLDKAIEAFSPNQAWRDWESEWDAGLIPARECLRRQLENIRVPHAALLDYFSRVQVDPVFAEIVAWARPRQVDVIIVSDNFQPLILQALRSNGIKGVPVFANGLEFVGEDRLLPSFPFHDPACAGSANAKARHLAPYRNHCIVFAGDGRSDIDPALAADVVFAKSTLAKELDAMSVSYHPFDNLEPLMEYLKDQRLASFRAQS
jgi:2-hydroxy-3-keto-5-methylthiopentenyl-1-phosphate phosphatase